VDAIHGKGSDMKITYITLLRGINVSGHKTILMDDLKALFDQMDFEEVKTYIQSGNIVFKTRESFTDAELAQRIQQTITARYHFFVPVFIRSGKEMAKILNDNPFLKEKEINPEWLHVTFLSDSPRQSDREAVSKYDFSPDRFYLVGNEAYLYCPQGYGNTKISNLFFENRLKVNATTRNWKTVIKLVELASK
jgi:uncharacterized protein (DUF1697 family)